MPIDARSVIDQVIKDSGSKSADNQ
jgi:hypothetical protein